MSKSLRKNGSTSNITRVKLYDSSSATGAGLTGLTFSSSGLIISTLASNEASATVYTAAGSTIETITTLGTFTAPTATKCRFKEVDATNHPGLYEIQIADARFAVASAKNLIISVSGATNLAQTDVEIQLAAVDPDSATAFITGVNSLAPPTNWNNLVIDGTGRVNAFLIGILTSVFTEGAAGRIAAAFKQFFNIATPASTMDALVSVSGSVGSVASGVVVTTNNDKAGYSLSAAGNNAVRDVDNTTPAAGSLGAKVNSAASAGDPWATSLPGAYGAGTAGNLVGNNVDAKASLIKAKTDGLNFTGANVQSTPQTAVTLSMTQAVPTSNTSQTVGDALNGARAQAFGKWVISSNTLTLYAGDATTVVRQFTLDSTTNPTQRV